MYSSRDLYGMGLYAGLTFTEMQHMFPGFIMDMYLKKVKNESMFFAPKTARRLLG